MWCMALDWCAWCGEAPITKRGTVCAACQLRMDHRVSTLEQQLALDQASSPMAHRLMETITDPEGRI